MPTKLRKAEILFALALFAFAVRFPAIDDLSDANLTFHMTVQHLLTFLPGYLFGVQLAKLTSPGKRVSVVLSVVAVALVVFWHLPGFWDLAKLNEPIHILEHLSFFIAAALVSVSLPALGSALKWSLAEVYLILSSILAANTMGGVRGRQIYQSSPASQHVELAIYMVATVPLVFLLIALSAAYMPRIANLWINRKLSLYASALLIIGLILGILLTG